VAASSLTAVVSVIDPLLGSHALSGQSYRRANVLIDHEFDDIDDNTDMFEFDFTKIT